MSRRTRAIATGGAGAAALIAVLVYLLVRSTPGPVTAPAIREVSGDTIVTAIHEVPRTVEATGVVVSAREVVLASKVLAAVTELRAREGSAVKAGDIVIALDDRDLRADLERAEAERSNAASRFERLKPLAAQGLASPQTLEDAERALKVAEAARASAAALLAATTIRAPFDAVVTDRAIEVGDMATPGRPLLTIEDARSLRLEVTVAGEAAGAIRRGARAEVVIDALGGEPLDGSVGVVIPRADPATQSVTVKVEFPRVPGLRSGMYGRARFEVGRERALALPVATVSSVGALDRVYVIDAEGVVRARLVRIGRRLGAEVEVLSGLDAGERVLADAARGVDGARFAGPPAP